MSQKPDKVDPQNLNAASQGPVEKPLSSGISEEKVVLRDTERKLLACSGFRKG